MSSSGYFFERCTRTQPSNSALIQSAWPLLNMGGHQRALLIAVANLPKRDLTRTAPSSGPIHSVYRIAAAG